MAVASQFGANKAMKRPTAFNQSWSFGLDFLGWCAKIQTAPPLIPMQHQMLGSTPTFSELIARLGLAALLHGRLAIALSLP